MKKSYMQIFIGGLLSVFLLLSVCCLVYADEAELTEANVLPAVPEKSKEAEKGFHGILGAGLFMGQNIVGERHIFVFPFPFVSVRYSDWAYWHLNKGGVWLFQSPGHSLKLGLGLGLRSGWSSDRARWYSDHDDPLLEGMADRHMSLDGSVNALWKTPFATIGVSYFHDILGVSDGTGAMLRISRIFPIGQKFTLTPFAAVEWESKRLVNYYYGVRPEEATATRQEYHGRDTVNLKAGLWASYRLTQSWSVMGGAHIRRLGDGIYDSPIVLDRYGAFSFLGVGWRF